MVREKLGATETQMKRWIRLGFLESGKLNNGGWSLYSEEAIQRVINRINDGSIDILTNVDGLEDHTIESGGIEFSGEDATRVFSLIGEGISLAQIQIRTQIHPYVLRAIKKEFDYLEESITVPKIILDQMNRVRLPGNFPIKNATDILDIMRGAEEDRLCPECRVQPCADQCAVCLRKKLSPPPQPPPVLAKSSDTRIQAPVAEIVETDTAAE